MLEESTMILKILLSYNVAEVPSVTPVKMISSVKNGPAVSKNSDLPSPIASDQQRCTKRAAPLFSETLHSSAEKNMSMNFSNGKPRQVQPD